MSDSTSSEHKELLLKGSPSETLQNKNDSVIAMESESENKKSNDVKDSVNLLNSKELQIQVCVIK